MIAIAPYRVSVNVSNKEQPLTAADGKCELIDWTCAFLQNLVGKIQIIGESKMVRLARVCKAADSTFVCGICQTGDFGYKAELVDSTTNTVSHERQVPEAEMVPFFFALFVPKGATFGVLLLQRFKNFGIRGILVPDLIRNYDADHKNASLKFDPLVPQALFKTILEQSVIKSMRLIQYSIPKDVSDLLGEQGGHQEVSNVEVTINAKRDGALPKIAGLMDLLEGKKNFADIATLTGFECDNIKLEVEFAGSKRVLDFSKPMNVNPDVDITAAVPVGDDGHPVWDAMLGYSIGFAEDVFAQVKQEVAFDAALSVDVSAEEIELSEKAVLYQEFAAGKIAVEAPKFALLAGGGEMSV